MSDLTVVKIGGVAAADPALTNALAVDLMGLVDSGYRIVLVHGGGTVISDLQKHYGLEATFVDGIRQTPPEEMPLVDMALAGRVNKELVRLLNHRGVRAWGLCGADAGVLSAESVAGDAGINRTGRVTAVVTEPVTLLLESGYLPVFAPPASDGEGRGINVNADEAALAVAAALTADRLVFLSDVPGVLQEGAVVPVMNSQEAEEKISAGIIHGGMIPKVRSAVNALDKGVGGVVIGTYRERGDLTRLLRKEIGTLIRGGRS